MLYSIFYDHKLCLTGENGLLGLGLARKTDSRPQGFNHYDLGHAYDNHAICAGASKATR